MYTFPVSLCVRLFIPVFEPRDPWLVEVSSGSAKSSSWPGMGVHIYQQKKELRQRRAGKPQVKGQF